MPTQGDLPYYIAVNVKLKQVVLAVRGTWSMNDVATDVLCEPASLEDWWEGIPDPSQPGGGVASYVASHVLSMGLDGDGGAEEVPQDPPADLAPPDPAPPAAVALPEVAAPAEKAPRDAARATE